MPAAYPQSTRTWPLQRKVAWAALLVAILGWSSMLQPPRVAEPLPLSGVIVA